MKKLTIFILSIIVLIFPFNAFAYTETFYVCEGGDGTLPETNTCATAYDLDDLNTSGNWDVDDSDDGKIGPNDCVEIMDDGGDYNEGRIIIQQPGLSGKHITIKAQTGDTPVINPSRAYSSWTEEEELIIDEASTANNFRIFNVNGRQFVGQGDWTADDDYVVSSMEMEVQYIGGTGPGTVVAEIYNVDGNNLGTQPSGDCTSDSQTVDSVTTYKFIGMSCELTDTNSYQLVFTRTDHDIDADNWMHIYYDGGGDSWNGQMQQWTDVGANGGKYNTFEIGIKVYQKTGLYYAAYTTEPNQVFWDDSLLTEETVKANIGTGEWYNDEDNDRIYLYDNPSGHTVEAGYWGYGFQFNGKSYITLDGITFEKARVHNIYAETLTTNWNDIVIQNCTARQGFHQGIAISGDFQETNHGVSTGVQILNNTLTDNGVQADILGEGTGFAINVAGNHTDDYVEDVVIRSNIVTSAAHGIKMDWFGNDGLIEYNYVNVDGASFDCDACQNCTWKNNIADTTDSTNGFAFNLYRWEGAPGPPFGFALSGNTIINNTICNSQNGIKLNDDETDTVVKNNIFHGDFASNIPVRLEGGETYTNLDIDYNLYYTGANTSVFTETGVDTYNFAEWQALGHDTHSPTPADPLFTNAAGDDFTLKPGSPCRHGSDPSLTSYTTKLRPNASWPDNVVTMEDILSIGAYGVYRGSAGM